MRGEDSPTPPPGMASTRITPACAGKTSAPPSFALYRQDHPRMRGEDPARRRIRVPGVGSPPHARGRLAGLRGHDRKVGITPACAGKTIKFVVFLFRFGITPACAGKTAPRECGGERRWDHPRMRGEDTPWLPPSRYQFGSPPHARGRRQSNILAWRWSGITPACAGKTTPAGGFVSPGWDHPRMRGEDCT